MQIIPVRFASPIYALLRLMSGLMFAMHGSQKLLGWPHSAMGTVPLTSLPGIAGLIELVGGLLIAIGFLTRLAAFISSGLMAVAYFMAHAPHGFLPIVNKGELAVLYCFLFLYFAVEGGGLWSVDGTRRRQA